MPANRQLAAILFTDIEGYSAILQDDEQKGMAIRNRHREIVQKEHTQFNGRIIQYYGDGTLSIFQSAIDAVQCAVTMQQAFCSWPQVPVRMGLHIGEIVFDDEHVFGNGVNLASRIESLGVAGSVLISDKVNDEIQNHPEFKTVSVGIYQLKNIERGVEVFALAHIGLKVPAPYSLEGKTGEKKSPVLQKPKKLRLLHNSIAVLPFRNISSDTSIEWLSDGFTEELTSAIAGISDLKVKSSTAMRQYKNSDKTFIEMSEELHVANFIEGNVQKDGNNIIIRAHLIKTKTGEILRPFRFNKDFSEINFIYRQMAQEVADDLNVILNNSEKKRLQQMSKVHAEAHQFFLQGRYAAQKLEKTEILEAVNNFNLALQKEPDYPPALAGLALCYNELGYLNAIMPAEALEKIMPLLDKALLLEPNLAFAHSNLGWAKMWFQWDLKGAEEEFLKSNNLDPSDVNCIQGIFLLNLHYGNLKKAEYWRENGEAVAPNDFWLNLCTGLLLFYENKIPESITFLKDCNARYNHPFYNGRIGWIYTLTGQYEAAIDIIEKTFEQHKLRRPALLATLASAYFQNGDREKAQEIFNELEKNIADGKANHAFYTAAAYAFTGNKEKALSFLYKAYELHDIELLWIKADPMLNSIKDHRFYQHLLNKMGLD
jgi:adenylate cyclase